MEKKATKKSQIYNYMKNHEYITSMDAFRNFNATRLAAVICDMRKHGVPIRTEMFPAEDGTPYARYYLEEK